MAYEGPGSVRQGMLSRRSLLKTTAAGVAAGALASTNFRIAEAADGLRSIGLGVSEINEIQAKATKDLGFPVAGQAMGYGEMFGKMLNQNDQYEIAEGYYNDMGVMEPAKVWQPIDTKKIKDWDKVTNLTKTGKLTPESSVGQGDAPLQVPVDRRERQQGEGTLATTSAWPRRSITPTPSATTRRRPVARSKAGANSSTRSSRARWRCSTCRRSA